ncbi:OsmC family protein [Bacillus methanolicus]|uniref:OsmC family protein n=1 Tax=Bacillus methanolicus (strain MGA3 / ATCC 53907) TaxID=796606 RepID=I3E370_BACMM|nr:OsmC family protein [Bacillus methanolicus]AIE58966.1 OsmC family protein [Bacillus methanolicus MGA3]EIJ80941.1 OsmC family protein [Bacillus methanolicus MGA3]
MAQISSLIKVSAKGKWDSGVKTNITVRNFPAFSTDEPTELGGSDTAPNPMEYVCAALNGCNGVMIPLVAKELDFSFSGIDFETTGIVDIRGLMGEEGVSPHFQKIRFRVNIQTEESEERIEQLKNEVERRCPVMNLLLDAGVKVDSKWSKI